MNEPDPNNNSELASVSFAQAVVSKGFEPFVFYLMDEHGELTDEPFELTLHALGQKEWSYLDQQSVKHYAAQLAASQKAALEQFGSLLTPEQVQARIDQFIEAQQTLTTEAVPQKMMQSPVLDAKGEPSGKYESIAVPYQAWWSGNTEEGQIHTVWISARRSHPDLSLADLKARLESHPQLEAACMRVVALSQSKLGKSLPAGPGRTKLTREQRAEKRKRRRRQRG
jgi:hypothetical protein